MQAQTNPHETTPPDAAASQPSASAPDYSVVIPVHNERENIEPLFNEICASMVGQSSFEVVYVDDGSNDGTLDVLKTLVKSHPELRTIHHHQCCGQSTAIATGVRMARASVIITLDGDGQNDPADIPKLLEEFLKVTDPDSLMIAGLRAKRRDNWLKRLSSRIANNIRAGLLRDNTRDTGCGLKIFSRNAFLDMPRFDHMHRFLPALMRRRGGTVISVPVHHRPRERGQSKYGVMNRLWVGIVDLFGVIWLQHRTKNPDISEIKPE